MINLECLGCKCDTCQDSCCKNGTCHECSTGDIAKLVLDVCQGYCVSETVDQGAPVKSIPFRKLLVLNGKYYTGNKEFNGKRSEAVVIDNEKEYKMLVGVLFCKIIDGETELRRVEVIDPKEVEG